MPSAREAFLQRVHDALQQGNQPGVVAEVPPRGQTGYQGSGGDAAAHFCAQLMAAGGQAHRVADRAAAIARVLELIQTKGARSVLLGRGPFIDELELGEKLTAAGVAVVTADSQPPESSREAFFAADVGVTGVDHLIGETGSIAAMAKPSEPRSFSLLPPVHIAVALEAQILPDLFDLFTRLGGKGRPKLPSCLALITGPSKTGDIELKLVTGVHGPGEVHVVLIAD